MKLERLVPLTLLTTLLYSFSFYLQYGKFIFPFPLYDIVFFVIVAVFYFTDLQFRASQFSILSLIGSLFLMLSSRFFLELFLSDQKLEVFLRNGYSDVIQLFGIVIFTCWIVIQSYIHFKSFRFYLLLIIVGFGICWLMGLLIPSCIFSLVLFYLIYAPSSLLPTTKSILSLYLFFYLTKGIMLI